MPLTGLFFKEGAGDDTYVPGYLMAKTRSGDGRTTKGRL
jgi:hypothetical protein